MTTETKAPFIRTPYNYDMNEASLETALFCKDASKTKQEFKDDADINSIIERQGIGYQAPINARMPLQGDFTGLTSFEQAMTEIRAAQETFNALPAKVRYRFNNEPGRFVEFCSDPNNQDEAVKLGLASRFRVGETTPEPAKDAAPPPGGAKTG